jgi:hypothetical protein
MNVVQAAYCLILGVAWTWAYSQVHYAFRYGELWPPPWRLTAGFWLTVKAGFLTYIGVHTWTILDDHRWPVFLFALAHVVAFAHWLTLPPASKAVPVPPVVSEPP